MVLRSHPWVNFSFFCLAYALPINCLYYLQRSPAQLSRTPESEVGSLARSMESWYLPNSRKVSLSIFVSNEDSICLTPNNLQDHPWRPLRSFLFSLSYYYPQPLSELPAQARSAKSLSFTHKTISKALSTRFRPIGETTSITSLAVLILSRWLSRSASGRKSYFYASFLNATVFRESAAGPKLHDSLLMYFSIHPEPKHPKGGRLIAVENE